MPSRSPDGTPLRSPTARGALALFGVAGLGLDGPALAYALVLHWWTYLVQAATAWWFFRAEGESVVDLAREATR